MFGWLRPQPPLDTFEKTWVERRMRWLVAQFGIERLRQSTVLLPTTEYFPDAPPHNESEVRPWMERVAGMLDIDPSALSVEIVSDKESRAAGQYIEEHRVICLHESVLDDTTVLVKVLAHELAHDLLLAQGRLPVEVEDHEWVTDLLPVLFGFGVFCANCTVEDRARTRVGVEYWSIRRLGYLPSRMFGYALALFALARDEVQPAWMQWLRRDALVPMKQGLAYIHRTSDCVFVPGSEHVTPQESEVCATLRTGSPTARLDAVWEVRDRKLHTPAAMDALVTLISDPDPDVALQALNVLGEWPHALDDRACRTAASLIEHSDIRCCVGALKLLAKGGIELPRLISRLQELLHGDLPADVRTPVLNVLATLGRDAEPLVPLMMPMWKRALVDARYDLADAAALVVLSCMPQPEEYAQSWFDDPELRTLARRTLRGVATTGGALDELPA
jgi:hypothetical protein